MSPEHPAGRDLSRGEALALALALTVAAWCVPHCWVLHRAAAWTGLSDVLPLAYLPDFFLLSMGLVLALPVPVRCGLRVGDIRIHWPGVLAVTLTPVLLTAIVYPALPERPFARASASMWLLSPLAQDLLFLGVLYRYLEPHFAGQVHPRVPVRWVLPVGGAFFALWHVPNVLSGMSPGYVAFQCGYTLLGYVVVGLARQWTGSIFYTTAAHMAGNWIPWYVG